MLNLQTTNLQQQDAVSVVKPPFHVSHTHTYEWAEETIDTFEADELHCASHTYHFIELYILLQIQLFFKEDNDQNVLVLVNFMKKTVQVLVCMCMCVSLGEHNSKLESYTVLVS